jgi:hypothetical protein
LLWAIAIPTIAALVGLAIYFFALWRGKPLFGAGGDSTVVATWQVKALVVLAIACIVAYLAVVQFGTSFALAQARYFFPVVNAAAILLMLGLRTLVPLRFRPAGQGIVVAALIALNVVIMTAYVLPFTVTFDDPLMPWSWGG